MIITMKSGATQGDVSYVLRRAQSLGLKAHLSEQQGHKVIGLLGELDGLDARTLGTLRGVDRVQQSTRPFRLCSREFKSQDSVIQAGECLVGGNRIAVMAGPCSVETREQVLATAEAVRAAGGQMLRGGAFKPRTSPYSWRGLAEEGLKILAEAREATGLAIVTEVMSCEHVPLVSRYADVLQIGARNMQNYPLLTTVGETRLPVLLKRGMMSTIEELLLCAEYILAGGNPNVILCERGIRTFETYTRNTLDINAVPLLKELTHLPVIVDPSHATGKASLVRAVSRAAIAAGADGLLVEVHPEPESAWSDGFQSITPWEFAQLMDEAQAVGAAVGRAVRGEITDEVAAR